MPGSPAGRLLQPISLVVASQGVSAALLWDSSVTAGTGAHSTPCLAAAFWDARILWQLCCLEEGGGSISFPAPPPGGAQAVAAGEGGRGEKSKDAPGWGVQEIWEQPEQQDRGAAQLHCPPSSGRHYWASASWGCFPVSLGWGCHLDLSPGELKREVYWKVLKVLNPWGCFPP